MRLVLVGIFTATLVTIASADSPKPTTPDLGSPRVLTDGRGNYLVFDDGSDKALSKMDERVYFGSARRLHRFRRGPASKRQGSLIMTVEDPRHRVSQILVTPTGAKLRCDDERIPLVEADAATTARLRRAKRIQREPYPFTPRFLFLTDDAQYMLVERSNEVRGSFRLYFGPAEKMKRLKVQRASATSFGYIFVTSAGTLIARRPKADIPRPTTAGKPVLMYRPSQMTHDTVWRPKRGKEQAVHQLSLTRDHDLLYNRLSVYLATNFGTPCEVMLASQSRRR